MNDTNNNIYCTYRCWTDYYVLTIAIIFNATMIYGAVWAEDIRIWLGLIISYIYMLYWICEIVNRRVILTEEKLISYNIWGIKREYSVKQITEIAISDQTYGSFLLIRIGKDKVKLWRYAKGYEVFRNRLLYMFGIKYNSRYRKMKYDVKRGETTYK